MRTNNGDDNNTGNGDDNPMDMKSVEADIANGARAYTKLLNHSADDWTSWSITIVGLRGLRNLAFANAQTSNVLSQAYRDAMSGLLMQRKYSVYGNISKQTRSACYKLADSVEEVSGWYAALAPADQLRWKHPEAIVKHCPKNLVAGGKGDNRPPRKASAKKPITSFEVERLKALLIQVIKRLAKYEPNAVELLDQVTAADPNDELPEDLRSDDDDREEE